jgi:hypothetical protein
MRTKEIKAIINPVDLKEVILESKNMMRISTKEKTYLYKFATPELAKEWVTLLSQAQIKAKN